MTTTTTSRDLADAGVVFLVVSGKMASGKDTVAPAVMAALGLDLADCAHHYYANVLKDEVDGILAHMRAFAAVTPDPTSAAARAALAVSLAAAFDLPADAAEMYAGELYTEALNSPTLHARERTAVMRQALQHLGGKVRREQDANYLASRALASVTADLAAGVSVFATDARFPNEVTGARALGAFTVRLEISSAEQLRRLSSRDGLTVDPAVLAHSTETALDEYTGFDVVVNNEGALADTVATIVAAYRAAGEAR